MRRKKSNYLTLSTFKIRDMAAFDVLAGNAARGLAYFLTVLADLRSKSRMTG